MPRLDENVEMYDRFFAGLTVPRIGAGLLQRGPLDGDMTETLSLSLSVDFIMQDHKVLAKLRMPPNNIVADLSSFKIPCLIVLRIAEGIERWEDTVSIALIAMKSRLEELFIASKRSSLRKIMLR